MTAVFLLSTNAFAYPKECADVEKQLKALTAKAKSGKDPGSEINSVISKMNAAMDKNPDCKKSIIPLAQELTESLNKLIDQVKAEDESACGSLASSLINLTFEMRQEFNKTKSADLVMSKYKSQLDKKINEIGAFGEKNPDCRKTLEAAMTEARIQIKDIQPNTNQKNSENISYDEWFNLYKTGIKSGKKYSFVACVNGARNATSIRCHTSGSEAKRIFYNTDDIKDSDTKKKWVNTLNELQCVTAYVTGGEAFVVDVKNQNECK